MVVKRETKRYLSAVPLQLSTVFVLFLSRKNETIQGQEQGADPVESTWEQRGYAFDWLSAFDLLTWFPRLPAGTSHAAAPSQSRARWRFPESRKRDRGSGR